MSQERMHPEDLRAIVAAIMHASGTDGPSSAQCLRWTDSFLSEVARTAKPEAREPLPGEIDAHISGEALDAMTERAEKAEATLLRLGYPEDGRKSIWEHVLDRAENAEARVKELEDAIRFHQSSLVAGHEVDRQLWSKVK